MEIRARSKRPGPRAAARSRREAQAGVVAALHVSEEKCRLMLEAVSDGIAVFDLEGYLTEVNARGVEMCGAGTRDDLLGKKIFELLAPHERERARTNMRARLEQGTSETVEYTLLRMDGSEFPCELGSNLVRDASGDAVGFIVVVRDITERKRAEEALQESEERLHSLFDTMSEGVVLIDRDGQIIQANSAAERILGLAKPQIEGRSCVASDWEILRPDGTPMPPEEMAGPRAMAEKAPVMNQVMGTRRPDGTISWMNVSATPMLNDLGDVDRVVGTFADITERKQAEEALRESEERARSLVATARDAIVSIDRKAAVVFWNSAAEAVFGYSAMEAMGQPLTLVIPERFRAGFQVAMECMVSTDSPATQHPVEMPGLRRDGTEFPTEISWAPWEAGGETFYTAVVRDITERKRAEKALRESEEKFRAFTESAPDFVLQLDLSGRVLFLNRTHGRNSVEEVVGSMAVDHLPEEYRARFAEALARVAEKGEPQVLEHPIDLPGGEARWFSVRLGPLEADGRVDSVLLVARDVTEHRLAQEALRESETRFRTLADATFEGILLTEEGRIVDANQQLADALGYELNEMLGMEVMKLAMPEDRKLVESRILSGDEAPYELRGIRKDGTVITVEVRPRMMVIGGRHMRVTAMRDITENKRTEGRRRLTTQVLELLNQHLIVTEAMRDILPLIKEYAGVDAAGIRLRDGEDFPYYCTEGFPTALVEGERYLCARDQSGEVIRDPAGNAVLECLCGGIISGRMDPELPCLTESGSLWTNDSSGLVASMTDDARPYRFRGRCALEGYESLALVPLRAGPEIIGLLQLNGRREGMFTLDDIHFFERLGASIGMALSRKRVEDALAESEERFRKVVENAAEAIIVAQDGILKFGNARLCEFTGYTSEEVISKQFLGFIHPDDRDMVAERHAARQEGGSVPRAYPLRIIHREGHTRWVQINAAPTEWGGRPATLGLLTDITDRMKAEEEKARMEQQLHLAGRLAAVGELAAGVAHELNNPLAAIQGFAEFLSNREDLDEDTMSDIAVIYKEAQRATRVTANLLSFARRHHPQKAAIAVNEALEKSLELHTYRMRVNNIEVVTDLAPDLPLVMADFHQIQQVFVNIVTNAEHAMMQTHGRGNFLIKTQQKKKAIRIVFKDDGPGIPEQNLPSLFDPFFTTKEVGQGTGLGLSICYGIVQDHGGQLWAESKSGEGATFVVELPIADEEQPEGAPAG